MRKRQLTLPGLKAGKPERRAGARRDWTEAEFKRAIARNGFECRGAVYFMDVAETGLIFEGVHTGPPLRLARRDTLAKILRERDAAAKRTTSEPPVRITGKRSESHAAKTTA
jgi:hypothetical protein